MAAFGFPLRDLSATRFSDLIKIMFNWLDGNGAQPRRRSAKTPPRATGKRVSYDKTTNVYLVVCFESLFFESTLWHVPGTATSVMATYAVTLASLIEFTTTYTSWKRKTFPRKLCKRRRNKRFFAVTIPLNAPWNWGRPFRLPLPITHTSLAKSTPLPPPSKMQI